MAKGEKPVSPEDKAEKKTSDLVKYWLGEVESAQKREKDWRKEGRELIKIVEGEWPEEIPYNILYSNTETLGPALYSQIPRPECRPRASQESATAMAAAGLCDSYLENFIDNGTQEYCSLDTAIKSALKSALVPGRGVQRFHYRAEVESDVKGPRRVKEECVHVEELDWDKILLGYARTWVGVPWLAFTHVWTREEAIEAVGEDPASELSYLTPSQGDENDATQSELPTSERIAVATVYEIWNKRKKQILWVEAGSSTDFVKPPESDPYKLEGFFPIQQPLQFVRRLSSTMPVPLYRLYKQQAKELNKITRRIDKIIDQLKVRGFYDEGVEGLKSVLESDDGVMIPIRNLAALGQGAKAENSVWLVPIEKHVTVLQQLLVDRQSVKQVIFEIMGIADIMRGSTQASETLGAQEIKTQWGTLRLKEAQGEVARFIRDGLRIAAELGFSKMSPDTLRKLTGSTLPSAKMLKEFEARAKQAQAMGQPLDPNIAAQLALPSFEECLEALKNDQLRGYMIDIESHSSVAADATEDKQDVTEFLTAFSQFLTGAGPMIESGALPFDAAKAIMMNVSKRFNLGRQLYREIGKMRAPTPAGGPDPKIVKQLQDEKGKLEQQAKALEEQKRSQELEKIKFEAERRVFDIQKQADAAIRQAQDQSRQAQSTAQGAAKAAQDKAMKVKDAADMQKTMLEMGALLKDIQTAAKAAQQTLQQEQRTAQAELTAERTTKQAEFESKLKDELSAVVQQIQSALDKTAKTKRVARKQPDGSWASEVVS